MKNNTIKLGDLNINPNPWKNDKHFKILAFDTCNKGPSERELYKLTKFTFNDSEKSLTLKPLQKNYMVLYYIIFFIINDDAEILNIKVDGKIQIFENLKIDYVNKAINEIFLKYIQEVESVEIFFEDSEYIHQTCLLWYYESVFYSDDFIITLECENWQKYNCL